MNSRKSIEAPKDSKTMSNDESICDTAELVLNGELINWRYWLARQDITPSQAAKLAYCIDPIAWSDDQCKQGAIRNELRIKIRRCAEWLAERNQTWTLPGLVEALGTDFAPHRMKQAVWIDSADKARAQQLEEMRRAGLYTLETAAAMLEQFGKARAASMLKKLMRAVRDRNLLTHAPGLDERYESDTVREFYEVATSENLNAWLAENEPGIKWRFPAPVTEKVGASRTAAIEETETKNWKLLVQAEAAKRWKNLRGAGANPTRNSIKDDLSNWCRETGVLTDGDINPSGEYIYRHVLRKWTPPKD